MKKNPIYMFILVLSVVVIFAYVSIGLHEKKSIKGFEIIIHSSNQVELIDEQTVKQQIFSTKDSLSIASMEVLNLLEKQIEEISLIENAEVYKKHDGQVFAIINDKIPVLRYVSNNQSYYLDEKGCFFSLSKTGSIKVPLVYGDINSVRVSKLVELIGYLNQNEYFKNELYQVELDKGNIELYFRSFQFSIDWGELNKYREKAFKLNTFLKFIKQKPEMVSNKIRKISLKFKNQIITT